MLCHRSTWGMAGLVLSLVLLLSGTALALQDSAFRALLGDFEKKNQDRLRRYDAKMEAKLQPVVEAMRQAIVRLKDDKDATNAKMLEDALKNLLGNGPLGDRIDTFIVTPTPLATGIHAQVLQFEDDMLEINRAFSKEQAEQMAKLLKQIDRQVTSFKKNRHPDLERAQKLRADLLSIPNPQFQWLIPELPKNEEDAKLLLSRTQQELKMEADRGIRRSLIAMFSRLYDLRVDAMKVGNQELVHRLDRIAEAFRLSTLSTKNLPGDKPFQTKEGFFGRPEWLAPADWIKLNRKELPNEAIAILEDHALECKTVAQQLTSCRLDLNKKWKPFAQRDLLQALRSDSDWRTRKEAVQQFLELEGKRLSWTADHREHPFPGSLPEVMKELQRFDDESQQRLKEADEQDAKRRALLLAEFGPIVGESDSQRLDRETLHGVLDSQYASGLRGSLIFEPLPNLSNPLRAKVVQYLQQCDAARTRLETAHRKGLDSVRKRLEKPREDLLRDARFEEALLIDAHLYLREHPFAPLWVRAHAVPRSRKSLLDYGGTFPCSILSRDGDNFLIDSHTGVLTQQPRQGLVFHWREIQQSPNELQSLQFEFIAYMAADQDPATRPMADHDDIQPGQEVLVCRFRGWHKGVVVDHSPFGLVIDIYTREGSPAVRDLVPKSFVRWIIPNP